MQLNKTPTFTLSTSIHITVIIIIIITIIMFLIVVKMNCLMGEPLGSNDYFRNNSVTKLKDTSVRRVDIKVGHSFIVRLIMDLTV